MSREPWATSWTALAEAIDAFRQAADDANPESPEFPQAGRTTMHRGEFTPPAWAVARRFHGQVIYEGEFAGLDANPEKLMPGQPFKITIKMPDAGVRGFASTNIYPKPAAVALWRAATPGTTVRFRSRLRGIGAMDAHGGAFMAALNMIENTQPHLAKAGGPYLYFILLTDAEPLAAPATAP